MIKNIIALVFLCVFGIAQAQIDKLDSLKGALQKIPVDHDTMHMRQRAEILIYQCREFANAPQDHNNFTARRATAHQLLYLSKRLNYLYGQREAFHAIAHSYAKQSRFPESIDTFMLCFKVAETMRDTSMMCVLASLIASNYIEMQQFPHQAAQYTKLCMDLSRRANRKHGLCACQAMLGDIYVTNGQLDSAETHIQATLMLAEQIHANYIFFNLYTSLAHIEALRKNYAAELNWLLRADKVYQEDKSTHTLQYQINLLIPLFCNAVNRGDVTTALGYQNKIEVLLPQTEHLTGQDLYYQHLSLLAEMQHRPAEALHYYKTYITMRDSVNNIDKTRRVTQLQMTYEFEQKQAAQAAAQERELALRDARNHQQRLIFGFVTLALLGGGAFWFYAYRQKQERRRSELELANLRTQINPHFIFNCLNSIYRYTKERDTETASKYLQKFSSLLRSVLENSRSEKVTLTRDLESLQLYADIEGLRFKEKLHFSIDMAPDIDPTFVEIPGMLIQPHVENAIWHGLMHRPTGGNIVVRLRQPAENLLRVEIEDDGIGRAAAAELASKSATSQKSLGQKITAERLRATGKLAHTETIDLFDAAGNAAGTRIVLDIPL